MTTVYESKLRSIWAVDANMANGLDWKKISCMDRGRALFVCDKCGGLYENFIDMELNRITDGLPSHLCRHRKNSPRTKSIRQRKLEEYGYLKDKYPELEREYVKTDNTQEWSKADACPRSSYRWKCPKCGRTRMETLESRLSRSRTCRCEAEHVHIPFSFPEKVLFKLISKHVGSLVENDRVELDGLELDMFDPVSRIGVEYDGYAYHSQSEYGKGKRNREVLKYEKCRKNGIFLIRVRESADPESECRDRGIADETMFVKTGNAYVYDFAVLSKAASMCISIMAGIEGVSFTESDISEASEFARKRIDDFKKGTKVSDNNGWLRSWYSETENGDVCFDDILVSDERQFKWKCPDCGTEMVSTPKSRIMHGCSECCHGERRSGFEIFQYSKLGKYERTWDSSEECARFHGTSYSYPGIICRKEGRTRMVCGHMVAYGKDVGWSHEDITCGSEAEIAKRTPMADRYPELVGMLAEGMNDGFDPLVDSVRVSDDLWWTVDGITFRQTVRSRIRGRKVLRGSMVNPPKTKAELRKERYEKRLAEMKTCSDGEIVEYWDFSKNIGTDPSKIGISNSRVKVFLKCPACGHEWQTAPRYFSQAKHKCKQCYESERKNKSDYMNKIRNEEEIPHAISLLQSISGKISYYDELRDKYPEIYAIARKYGLIRRFMKLKNRMTDKCRSERKQRRKPILRFDLDGNIIGWYPGLGFAMIETGIKSLPLVITHRLKTSGKSKWMYESEYIISHPEYNRKDVTDRLGITVQE